MRKRTISDRADYETIIDAFLSGVDVDEMPFHRDDVQEVLRVHLSELRADRTQDFAIAYSAKDFEYMHELHAPTATAE